MPDYNWQISRDRKVLQSGTIEAASEREALGMVLATQGEGKEPDACYSVRVGDSVMSSFGDEFEQSAEVTSWGADDDLEMGDRPFDPVTDVVDVDPQNLSDSFLDSVDGDVNPYGAGTDTPIGTALCNGGPGDIIRIRLNSALGSLYGDKELSAEVAPGNNITVGSPVRMGASGLVYEPVGDEPWGGAIGKRTAAPGPNFQQTPCWPPILRQAFGSNAAKVARIIESYGYRPEEAFEVSEAPLYRAHMVRGRYFERDGQEKWWQVLIDPLQLQ